MPGRWRARSRDAQRCSASSFPASSGGERRLARRPPCGRGVDRRRGPAGPRAGGGAAARLAGARPVEVPYADGLAPLFMREVAETHRELFAEHRDHYGPNVAAKVARCLEITDAEAEAAARARERYRGQLAAVFDEVDLLLTPTIPWSHPRRRSTSSSCVRATCASPPVQRDRRAGARAAVWSRGGGATGVRSGRRGSGCRCARPRGGRGARAGARPALSCYVALERSAARARPSTTSRMNFASATRTRARGPGTSPEGRAPGDQRAAGRRPQRHERVVVVHRHAGDELQPKRRAARKA